MCDTFISTPETSVDGCMILAKNSDRVPNEAQNVTWAPPADHAPGSTLRCTYIGIPQAGRTYGALLSRPHWMYGSEMGVNDRGVAIGNEAVFTKEPLHKKNDRLLGMDMMRIALERCASASTARDLIIELLEKYGQGGAHAPSGTLYYHNSFMIADALEAFVVETAGGFWVWKRIAGTASISNCLSIGEDFDAASKGLEDHARAKGYIPKGGVLDFQRDFSDAIFTHFARGKSRMACSLAALRRTAGPVTASRMMEILREHDTNGPFRPGRRPMERVCLHAGGLISTQSTGSMVAVLKKDRPPVVFMTGTSAPCLSVFKPHAIAPGLSPRENRLTAPSPFGGIDLYGSAGDRYSSGTLWWRGEDIHRRVMRNYPALYPGVREAFAGPERAAVGAILEAWAGERPEKLRDVCGDFADRLTDAVFGTAESFERTGGATTKRNIPLLPSIQWKGLNKKAGMPFV